MTDSRTTDSDDSIRQYLNEIGQVDLLTAEDERRLGSLVQVGLEAQNLLELVHEEEGEVGVAAGLKQAIEDGNHAKRDFTEANLRLVVSIAKKYQHAMPLLDIVQEGNLGLMHAVEKFDHNKGFKFSTYATWWIRQAITRAISEKGTTIRVPVHRHEEISAYQRTRKRLELESDYTDENLDKLTADKLGWDMKKIKEVKDIITITRGNLSLDEPVGEEGDVSLGDMLPDAKSDNPLDVVTANDSDFSSLLDRYGMFIDDREREVLYMRIMEHKTLEQVGDHFGFTRERARQLEAKAITKLRIGVERKHGRDTKPNNIDL